MYDAPEYENGIVWLEDPARHRYVRVHVDQFCPFRRRKPRFDLPGRLIGYTTLRDDARSIHGHFTRRFFWLKSYDPYDGGGMPCEGVDPLTLAPGVAGEKTERANGADLARPMPATCNGTANATNRPAIFQSGE